MVSTKSSGEILKMKQNLIRRSVATGAVFLLLIGFLLYYTNEEFEEKKQVKHSAALSPIDWLLGTWENAEDSMLFQEKWSINSANNFKGDGLLIVGQDTSFHENLSIIHLNGQTLYITQFSGQPAVMFNLLSSEGNYIIFENKEHIYPNKISYNLINDSTMIAGLEGKDEFGEFVKREFTYYRAD